MRQLRPASESADLFALYAHNPSTLRVNVVASVDGAATLDGRSAGLSGPADRRLFHHLRAMCDVVLVGAGTVRVEGYGSVLPSATLQGWRRDHGLSPSPRLAVASGSLALDSRSEVFRPAAARPIILTGAHPPAGRVDALSAVAEVVPGGSAAGWLQVLAERGLTRVLCEGGPGLFSSLVAEDLVDELCLTLSPLLAAHSGPGITAGVTPARALSLVHVLEEDGCLFLRYARVSGSAGNGGRAG